VRRDERLGQRATHVQKTDAIKAQQVFLRGNPERVDAKVFDIALQRTNRLRGITREDFRRCAASEMAHIGHEPG
jgi:hypothetical protein